MEIVRNAIGWGNGAGVLLPREWKGNQVKITLIDRTQEIKKEVFNILDSYLEDILGIYLVGSYARGEQEKESDIDIIAISGKTKKDIISGKYHLSITPLDSVKKTLEKNPLLVLPRLREAKAIMNGFLLNELINMKANKNSFNDFLEECKRIIKINKGLINLEKGDFSDSAEIVYSLVLRLRGIFLMKTLLENKEYSKKEFLKFISKKISEKEVEKCYKIYTLVKDNKKFKMKIEVNILKELIDFLESEVHFYE